MKYFQASFAQVVIRFYIMIAVALIAGFANIPLLGLLCIPIFLTAMLGIQFDFGTTNKISNTRSLVSANLTGSKVSEAA